MNAFFVFLVCLFETGSYQANLDGLEFTISSRRVSNPKQSSWLSVLSARITSMSIMPAYNITLL